MKKEFENILNDKKFLFCTFVVVDAVVLVAVVVLVLVKYIVYNKYISE